MRRGILVAGAWILAGCNTLSNALFYEDARFLAALPSAERLALPDQVLDGPVGDAVLLGHTVDAAAELDAHLAPVIATGEAIRAAPPTERTDVHRAWDLVTVALTDDEVAIWRVRATVAQSEGSDARWSAEVEAEGGWVEIASGRHAEDGSGELTWDLSTAALVLDAEDSGYIDVDYEVDEVGSRFVRVSRRDLLVAGDLSEEWALIGGAAVAYTDVFAVTDDPDGLPGIGVSVFAAEGGRAKGRLYRGAEEITVEECWDAAGDSVWMGGEDGVIEHGDEAACLLPEVQWE